MNRCDFMFRGETLSSRGYTLCEFDTNNSVSTVATDSQREFVTIPILGGRYQPIVCSTYNEPFIAEMSICKIDDSSNYIIYPKEVAMMKRWLSSPTPSEFRVSGSDYDGIFWIGVFNVEEIHADNHCVGFKLTFTATAPFGYKDKITFSGSTAAMGSVSIRDISDDEGYLYPDMIVTTNTAGDLKITNSFDNRTTIVKNCFSGESISFSHLMQITSTRKDHSLGDDFNYKFVRIGNTYDNSMNKLTFSLPCAYKISYNPIAKVVI